MRSNSSQNVGIFVDMNPVVIELVECDSFSFDLSNHLGWKDTKAQRPGCSTYCVSFEKECIFKVGERRLLSKLQDVLQPQVHVDHPLRRRPAKES
jgi:hypothetical protein